MGNERGSSSSRKGKKSSEKPNKQPQRGLGVAQLEKIRLHGQMDCSTHFNQEDHMRVEASFSSLSSPSFSYSPASYIFPSMPGVTNHNDQCGQTNIVRYIDSQPAIASSWVPNINIFEAQHFVQPNMARHMMFNVHIEGEKCNKSRSLGSSIQNSSSSDNQELDLELRLSL